jgi:hypothetical protein
MDLTPPTENGMNIPQYRFYGSFVPFFLTAGQWEMVYSKQDIGFWALPEAPA